MKPSQGILFLAILATCTILLGFAARSNYFVIVEQKTPVQVVKSKPTNFNPPLPLITEKDTKSAASTTKPVAKPIVKPAPKPAPGTVITAESYLIGNLVTGEVYLSKNPDRIVPIASITKIFTTLTAREVIATSTMIVITDKVLDAGYGSAGGLVENESFSPQELEYPLLLESSNDAAEALAASVGYDTYMQSMNALAQKIGLKQTRFFDPSGMSPGNVSNARDLFKLAQYLYANEQGLLEITRLPTMSLATTTTHQNHLFVNIDPFVYDPHFIGGKTGRTNEAKEAMLSLFTYSSGGITYPVGMIVLRSDFSARETDSDTLFSKLMTKLDSLHK
ncbi:MAG: hypothetical protein RIT04_632 [Candidatus Parcubacteria bacterium]|jgi:D-alanyl-D-alanine endopeptidase (penicillin-binding protein 7)